MTDELVPDHETALRVALVAWLRALAGEIGNHAAAEVVATLAAEFRAATTDSLEDVQCS